MKQIAVKYTKLLQIIPNIPFQGTPKYARIGILVHFGNVPSGNLPQTPVLGSILKAELCKFRNCHFSKSFNHINLQTGNF
jgi:hypothetical protein